MNIGCSQNGPLVSLTCPVTGKQLISYSNFINILRIYTKNQYTKFLIFMSADCDDLSELSAECELYMGKEMEKHVTTRPLVAIQPKHHAH